EVVVDEVARPVPAEVPVDARGPEVRARHAVLGADGRRDDPDAPAADLEDLVAGHELLELVDGVEDLLHHPAALGDPARGQVDLEAADPVEVGVEPPAGGRLDEVEDVLPIPEPVEGGGDGP